MGNGTSIGRVRGLGSAHSGVHHWLVIRSTAIGGLLLTIWFAGSILLLPDPGYPAVREWLASPVPATLMGLFVLVNVWHARLGLQVVIEDYVHDHANRYAALTALDLAAFAAAGFGLVCVARLALGGA